MQIIGIDKNFVFFDQVTSDVMVERDSWDARNIQHS